MSVTVYYSSVSGDKETKKKQQKIVMVLSSKKINFEQVDIAASGEAKQKMRNIVGDPNALAPQICNGDQYCGPYEAFEEALETETLQKFLKI